MSAKLINNLLDYIDIDKRIKPIIVSYFVGKLRLGNINEDELENQIKTLCERIENIEFIDTDKLVVAYEKSALIFTVSKRHFLEGKSENSIPLIFAKFEEILDDNPTLNFNNINNFMNGVKIAKSIFFPVNDQINSVYNILRRSLF